MQLSRLERLVVSNMIEGDPEQEALAAQFASATVVSRDYTGVGLYSKLEIASDSPPLRSSNRSVEDLPFTHVVHPSAPAGATVRLWLSDGFADTIEFCLLEGEWPADEGQFTVLNPSKPAA